MYRLKFPLKFASAEKGIKMLENYDYINLPCVEGDIEE